MANFEIYDERVILPIIDKLKLRTTNPSMINVGSKDGLYGSFSPYGNGFKYTGMEYDTTHVNSRNVIYGDITDCPEINDNSYDFVFNCNVLEHVKKPWAAVDNMVRITKPGGLLLIIAPFQWHYHEHPIDYWRFSPTGLEYLVTQHNETTMETLLRGYYHKNALSLYVGKKHDV